jgi:hypothetical protein
MKHITGYTDFEFRELMEGNFNSHLSQRQIDFLDTCLSGVGSRWEFNKETGLVDVYGEFNMTNLHSPDFKGVRFGRVTGNFFCDRNELTSLEGSPQEVGGSFDCSNNLLTDLRHLPKKIEKSIDISRNRITSLKGSPEIVNGSFKFEKNKIKTLEGGPKIVKGYYSCGSNPLESLEGIPDEIEGIFSYDELFRFHGRDLGLKKFLMTWDLTPSKSVKSLCRTIISEEYLLKRYEEDPEGTIMYIGKDWNWVRENYPKLYPEFREKIDKSDSETLDDLGDLKDLGF